jgi:hypothetical protein
MAEMRRKITGITCMRVRVRASPQRLFDSTARTSLKLADVTSIGPTS